MSWAKIDDQLPHHDKLVEAGPLAPAVFGLYVASLCYAQRHNTDGRISRRALALLLPGCPRPPAKVLAALVSVHLWDVDGDGWCIHDYLEDNLSAEERAAGKRANNVRQQRRRERLVAAARAAGVTRDSQRDEAVTHTDVTGPTPVPSLPVPSQTRPVPSQGPPDDLSITRTGHSEDDAGRSDAEHIAAIMRRRDELRRAKGYGPA